MTDRSIRKIFSGCKYKKVMQLVLIYNECDKNSRWHVKTS